MNQPLHLVTPSDKVAHEVTWKDQSIRSLAGQVIRLEFLLKNTDLYTFRATGK